MRYIDYLNGFWLMDEQKEFTPNETRLYFFLLHLANRFFWKESLFEYGDEKMQAVTGLSAGSLRTARNNLKGANLIDFVAGGSGKRVRTRYRILTPNPNPNPNPNLDPNLDPIPQPNPDPLYYNKIKIKTNKKNKKNERFSKREYLASGSDFDE